MDKIDFKTLEMFSNQFNKDLAKNAISGNPLLKVVSSRNILQKRSKVFSKKIKLETKKSNQQSSGRCWMFAFLNVLKHQIIKKYKLQPDFEFSQSYLFFWDKLEKANLFLYYIKNLKKEKLDSRLVEYLLRNPTNDGGQWNMLVNLVKKYGLVPKSVMNESYHSSHSKDLNDLLNNKLRDFAEKIRNEKTFNFEHAMQDIYNLLVIFLGEPPKEFLWEYEDMKGKFHRFEKIKPKTFYEKFVPFKIEDYVILVNAPMKSRPFHQLYDIKYFNNMVNGQLTNYINLPISELKKASEKSIEKNEPVFFGSDVGRNFNGKIGMLDEDLFDLEKFFGFNFHMDKGQRLEYFMTELNHAMMLKGFNKNGKINKWLVENSWGESGEFEGDIVMSDKWFDENVFEVVVHKKYLNKKIKDILRQKPVMLEPWDYFGGLMFL